MNGLEREGVSLGFDGVVVYVVELDIISNRMALYEKQRILVPVYSGGGFIEM